MSHPQALFVQCAHGNGDAQAAGEARGHLDCTHRIGVGARTPVLSAAERVAGFRGFRRVCREAVCEVLCGEVRAAVADAGDLLPVAAHRLFRGPRQRAWDRLAAGGFAGAAALCGHRARRVHARPLDDFAYAAADRCGHAWRSFPLGTELVSGSWTAAGQAGGAKGITVDDNDLILDPTLMLPPPRMRGRITSVRIQGDEIRSEEHTSELQSPMY